MEDPTGSAPRRSHSVPGEGLLLVLCGIDQFPESRSIVFSDAPGDFSGAPVPGMFAVRVEIEGRVCVEPGVCGPETATHGL